MEPVVRTVTVQPNRTRRFEKAISAENVGVDKGIWSADRAVNMTFRGKMDDRRNSTITQQTFIQYVEKQFERTGALGKGVASRHPAGGSSLRVHRFLRYQARGLALLRRSALRQRGSVAGDCFHLLSISSGSVVHGRVVPLECFLFLRVLR